MNRAELQPVEDGEVEMGGGRQDEGVAQPDDPVLGAVRVHLGGRPQHGDGRDEAAGQRQGGRDKGHLTRGKQELGGGFLELRKATFFNFIFSQRPLVYLAPPCPEHADEGREGEGCNKDQILLPPELGMEIREKWQGNCHF